MGVSELNLFRWRMLMVSREYKQVFHGANGEITAPGQKVLSDIRDFSGLTRATIFDPDPLIMARNEGRREMGLRVMRMLHLDEAQVQKLMEVDYE